MSDKITNIDESLLSNIFNKDGYFIVKSMASGALCDAILNVIGEHLATQLAPLEYEADVQYPGAPKTLDGLGGKTIRRLLHAYARDPIFRSWATSDVVKNLLQELFDSQNICLSQSHHNCVMTKGAGYSSSTLWHQDNRYWSFDEQNLVSVWLALGQEREENGCLWVIPQSHKMNLDPGRFDAASFLRTDIEVNQKLVSEAVKVELEKGDVVFFHSRLFHAAGKNHTQKTKKSLVFTYHELENEAIAETRSSRFPSIGL
ncbi:MAG: phytanoyl-CoA hydroxylase [Candidatus Azotimanducaceae bacterium]